MGQFCRIIIIYNPNSTGPSQQEALTLKEKLETGLPDMTLDYVATKYAGHAQELAYNAAINYHNPLIVSSSGDGGYHEVVNGAMQAQDRGAQPICAVLAAGNANDHRRTLRQSPLVQSILEERITTIDLLKVSIREQNKNKISYAHSYMGLGLTPIVAVELNRHSLNALKELVIVLKAFAGYEPFEIMSGKQNLKLNSLVIANISNMAKVLTVAKNARANDGIFEVVTLPYRRKLILIAQLVKAAFVGLKGSQANNFEFTAMKDMPMQLDGEVTELKAGSWVDIKCCHRCLKTIL